MSDDSNQERTEDEWDPVFLHSRREAILIFATWVVALLWTIPYCYLNGYLPDKKVETVTFILGMPGWVFWGIAVPWLVADVVAIWFCFGYFVDDDLDEAALRVNADTSKTTEGRE